MILEVLRKVTRRTVKRDVVSEWIPQPHHSAYIMSIMAMPRLSGSVVGTSVDPGGAQFRHKVEAGLSLYIPSHPSRLNLAQWQEDGRNRQ
jgi:hypothetical protein